jgi:ZIP family zinc transporter
MPPTLTVVLVSVAAFASTLAGGLVALRLQRQLHLILGFTAGAVLGVALFDLLPESLVLAGGPYGSAAVMAAVAAGYLAFLVLDRTLLLHSHGVPGGDASPRRGMLGAGSLCVHSLVDGLSIGLAFRVSAAVGAAVAVAVLVHDFADGINTVGLILKNRGSDRAAFRWLLADALAPPAGAAITLLFTLRESTLGLALAVFGGFFLYIGASDLVPGSHRAHPRPWTTAMTLLGAAVMFTVVRLAGG